LDEINKKISIFSSEKIVREHPIFSSEKIVLEHPIFLGGKIVREHPIFLEEKSTCGPYVKIDGVVKNDVAWSFWRLWMTYDPYCDDGCVWCFCGICFRHTWHHHPYHQQQHHHRHHYYYLLDPHPDVFAPFLTR
jgi:hypothetical protein